MHHGPGADSLSEGLNFLLLHPVLVHLSLKPIVVGHMSSPIPGWSRFNCMRDFIFIQQHFHSAVKLFQRNRKTLREVVANSPWYYCTHWNCNFSVCTDSFWQVKCHDMMATVPIDISMKYYVKIRNCASEN